MLSGLEGLGLPQVHRFGRLPETGRPYMVRDLVEGVSLQDMIDEGAGAGVCIRAIAEAAEQATVLHRAGLLHGDLKPANIIVSEGGSATLVDLGLAAPWQERGTEPQGLTPRFAAPELLVGGPLTVRAEVYALGATLELALESGAGSLSDDAVRELRAIACRAMMKSPRARHPSADEFASALRRAAALPAPEGHADHGGATWPVVGIDGVSARLHEAALELGPAQVLVLVGSVGSGRSTLLRRLTWALGVAGHPVVQIDGVVGRNVEAVEAELAEHEDFGAMTISIDDVDCLPVEVRALLERARRAGARIMSVGTWESDAVARVFEVPPLSESAAMDLVRKAVPSLTERRAREIVTRVGGHPGALRRFVGSVAEGSVVSDADVERALGDADPEEVGTVGTVGIAGEPLARALLLLDRGRYGEAGRILDEGPEGEPLTIAIAQARLAIGLGNSERALEVLHAVEDQARAGKGPAQGLWSAQLGRAYVGLGRYAEAIPVLESIEGGPRERAEARAYLGLARSYLGEYGEAVEALEEALTASRAAPSARLEGLALAGLGLVHQRADQTEKAREAYEGAILAAERAGDAGTLGTAQLNLAGLLKIHGDLAAAIRHFESAVDTGRRSGRLGTVRNAQLNLANLDLYLGRLSRARATIEALVEEAHSLAPVARAQLAGHRAELHARLGESKEAVEAYEECAQAYAALGHSTEAAEASLEGVLVAARQRTLDPSELEARIARIEAWLRGSTAHRPLLALARGSVAWTRGDEPVARQSLEVALSTARESGQRDVIWRALELRAEVDESVGQRVSARRDREETLVVLEEIAARLPRDLREVFWNDERRRALRAAVERTLGNAPTDHVGRLVTAGGLLTSTQLSSVSSTPLERRLSRILEINAELLGEVDLGRLAVRVTDHAVDMLRAERGHVILREPDGTLSVHTSRARGGQSASEEFSRSIAEQVMSTGEPVVSANARADARMRSYASVHQLMVQSVACVAISSPSGQSIGALYVETRLRAGDDFERELPILRAFADQVGIAIETTRLIGENQRRAAELEAANAGLQKAKAEIQELLGDRTAELARTRAKLRDARATLDGHFGYEGLVGTSAPMRRVYALIDRLKDTDVPVLVTGESGTGKEVVARAIHRGSPRAKRPFLGVNCGAIPDNLLESELFGHVRGAFTGADRDRKGLLREGEGGTVLLDEIGEMPHKMQAGLLRVLQEQKARPVGGVEELPVDTRMIFATHRDLDALVKQGRFREDLYYRIHVVEVFIPPLRDRREDIALLVDHFLGIFAARYKRERRTVSREALRRLSAYDWPGNVRQLEHVLLNAWVLADADTLDVEDFDLPDGRPSVFPARPVDSKDGVEVEKGRREPGPTPTLTAHRKGERARIIEALEASNWNRVKAAELSGIPRRTFYRRLKEYGIQ
jgi:serine/threonine-protein kinase PknK